MTEYQLISADNPSMLNKEINQLLQQGWRVGQHIIQYDMIIKAFSHFKILKNSLDNATSR